MKQPLKIQYGAQYGYDQVSFPKQEYDGVTLYIICAA